MPRPGSYGRVPLDERVDPPAGLQGEARELFLELIQSVRPGHFLPADACLLAAYCRAVIQERDATGLIQLDIANAPQAAIRVRQSAHQVVSRLCIRLRLSPQSRRPTVGSASDGGSSGAYSFYDRGQDRRLDEPA